MNRLLVTGAGSGLGRAIAARYRCAGARVLLTDVDPVAGGAAAAELGGDFAVLDGPACCPGYGPTHRWPPPPATSRRPPACAPTS